MPHPDVFTPALERPGDYDAQTAQVCAVMHRLALRLCAAAAPLRPSVTAVAQMMYYGWEKGIAGTHDPREAADRIHLQAMAAGLAG